MSFSPLEHLLGVVRFLVIVCGPLPLCAALLAADPAARSVPRRLLTVLTLWCVIQADIALIAGLLHRFEPVTVLVVELLLLAAGVAAAIGRREGWRSIVAEMRLAAQRMDGPTRMVTITLLLVGVSLLWHVAAIPVIDWDSWAFHMPAMARWLQAGEFVRLEQYALRPRNAYPNTWGAVCALFLMPFGEDAFVTLPCLVAWMLLGLATFTAARDLSAARLHALAAAAFVTSMPHLQGQVNSLHVDLPVAAFFMAALSFALAYHRGGRRSDLALFVAALGVLCGLRATGPVYAAALAVFLVAVRRWADTPTRSRFPAASFPLLAAFCAASFVFVGTFWWVKNIADFGNPLFPVRLTRPDLLTRTVPQRLSAVASTALVFAFDPFALASWKHVAERAWNEVGFPLPVMLAQLALWPLALRADRRPQGRQWALVAGMLVVGTGAIFLVTPLSAYSGIQLRLGFPALGAVAIAGAVAATGVRLPGSIAACLAIVAAVVTIEHSRVFQLGAALLIPAGIIHRWRPSKIGAAALGCLLCAAFVVLALAARGRRAQARSEFYGPAFAYIEQHVGEDEPVGYLLSDRSYYFYGTRLRRKVHYVPVPAEGPTREWFAQLRSSGIRAVITGPYGGEESARRTVERLVPPSGELVPVFGRGQPGEMTVYRFTDR